MLLTPVQVAFSLLCGDVPFMLHVGYRHSTLSAIIIDGHKKLVGITGNDFKCDLFKWHKYLMANESLGFAFHNQSDRLMELAIIAMASDEWKAAASEIENGNDNNYNDSRLTSR